jgi:hypothetical protein
MRLSIQDFEQTQMSYEVRGSGGEGQGYCSCALPSSDGRKSTHSGTHLSLACLTLYSHFSFGIFPGYASNQCIISLYKLYHSTHRTCAGWRT